MDRPPPHSNDAERAVLAALLTDYAAIADVADWLMPDAFYDGRHRVLYQAIVALWRVRRPCDLATLMPLLEARGKTDAVGGVGYIADVMTTAGSAVYVRHYAEIVLSLARQRAKIDAAAQAIAALWKEDVSAEEVAGMVRRAEAAMPMPNEATNDLVEVIASVRDEAMARWERRFVDPVISSGIAAVDKRTFGGFRGGDLIYVGGRPGSGKTSLAVQMAKAAMAGGKTALLVELEMKDRAILQRIIAAEANVPFATAFNEIDDQERRERWLAASGRVEEWPLVIDNRLASTDKIAAWCRRQQAVNPIGAIFVDHLDKLMDHDLARLNIEQKTSEISKRLKTIAMDLDVPVVGLVQLNRSVEAAEPYKPDMNHLRYSGSLEQDAEYILLLYRRMYYVGRGKLPGDDNLDYLPHSNRHRVEMNLAKNRNGETGMLELGFIPDQMRFVDRIAA